MDSLSSGRIAQVLERLHREAQAADREFIEQVMAEAQASGGGFDAVVAQLLESEREDYRARYRSHAQHFLSVSPAYGRFLYAMARARGAKRIVEFGTSMGVSTLYLAAALRDNGGGHLIGTEFEPGKVAQARANLDAAGLSDLVEIREGDALETLQELDGEVDLLLIDGAWSLYLAVLRLVEPHLKTGAVVLGENSFDQEFRSYIRNPANGYLSQPLDLDPGRSNEFAVRTA